MNKRTKRLIMKEMGEHIRKSSTPICKSCLKQESDIYLPDIGHVCNDCYDKLSRGDSISDIRED